MISVATSKDETTHYAESHENYCFQCLDYLEMKGFPRVEEWYLQCSCKKSSKNFVWRNGA
jgi:hypothetical protein